jgi:hypothetical protein
VHVTGGSTPIVAESAVKRLRDALRNDPHFKEASISFIEYPEAHVSLMPCLTFDGTMERKSKNKSSVYDDLLYNGVTVFFTRALHAFVVDARATDALPASEVQRL